MKPTIKPSSSFPSDRLETNFFAVLNSTVSSLQAAGADIIRLDIGSPDLPPPSYIVNALTQSAKKPGSHGYQPHRGTAGLRRAWADMYKRVYGVHLDPEGVLPLLGSKEGVFHLSLAVLNPGDVVLVPDPGYMTYAQGANFAQAELIAIPLQPENGYLPDLDMIPVDIARRAKILWLNYPNNPTGATATLEFFSEATAFCRRYGILLCHDAAYTQVTFDGYRAPSVLEVPGAGDIAVEFNTLSKSHNMAGWRVGAAAGRPDAVAALFKLKSHADSGHFLPVNKAVEAALQGDQSWLEERNAVYQERRDLIVTGLGEMGLSPHCPQASLYVWCGVPSGWESDPFVLALLEHAHVSLAPGTVFGPGGKGYVRISFNKPVDPIHKAMERIRNWLRTG